MSTLRHWLWLSTRGPAPGMYAARILEHFGTPEAAFFAGEADCARISGLPGSVRQALLDKSLEEADGILTRCETLGIQVLTMQDTAYPERLRQLETAPCVLYVKGRLPLMDEEAAVTIVGARRASLFACSGAEVLLSRKLAVHDYPAVMKTRWACESAYASGGIAHSLFICEFDSVLRYIQRVDQLRHVKVSVASYESRHVFLNFALFIIYCEQKGFHCLFLVQSQIIGNFFYGLRTRRVYLFHRKHFAFRSRIVHTLGPL